MIGLIGTSVTVSLNYNQYSGIVDLHSLEFTVAHALGISVSTSRLLATDLNTALMPVKVKIKETLRLAVYRQSIRLGSRPLETHDQISFQLNTCGNSPYVSSSLTSQSQSVTRFSGKVFIAPLPSYIGYNIIVLVSACRSYYNNTACQVAK
jgi:hypothetical protein